MDSRPVNEGRQRPLGGHLPSRPDPPYASPSRQRLAQGAGSWMLCSKLLSSFASKLGKDFQLGWVCTGFSRDKFGGPGGRGGETGFDQGTRRRKERFHECGARVWGTSATPQFYSSTPQGFQEKCFEFLGVVLRNSIDKFRFEIQEESVGSAPGGGAGLSRAYARAEQRFIDPHPRGPGSRSDQFIRLRGPVTGSQKPSSL